MEYIGDPPVEGENVGGRRAAASGMKKWNSDEEGCESRMERRRLTKGIVTIEAEEEMSRCMMMRHFVGGKG